MMPALRSFVCLVGYAGLVTAWVTVFDPGDFGRIAAAAGALVLGWHCQECDERERT